MSLRQKLLTPLLLISLLMGVYLNAVWIPRSLLSAQAEHLNFVERHLDSVVEGLIPLLLGNQLDILYENLDVLRKKNGDWIAIRLLDAKNRQIFPLLTAQSFPSARPGQNIHTIEKPIRYLDMALGKLVVTIDMAPSLAGDREHHRMLAMILLGILVILVITIALTLELAVLSPVRQLSAAARELALRNFNTALPGISNDEVGILVGSFSSMRHDLSNYHSELIHEIAERKLAEEKLKQLNETLEQRVLKEVNSNRQKDIILIQQSRLAAMGEMVHNIAHQWRQPLSALGLLISNIQDDFSFKTMTKESLDEDVATAYRLINRMSTTIDDFRNFFRPDREKSQFDIAEAAKDAAFILEAAIQNNHIELKTNLSSHFWVLGFANQYAQAVLNLLVNAKEAILAKHIKNGNIYIELHEENGCAVLTVEDNAGGIPEDVLPRIFDPYFTTKDQGSGIGLYMVKMIIEKNMGGHIEAVNTERGAKFSFVLPRVSPVAS